jgi:hypothetical protein
MEAVDYLEDILEQIRSNDKGLFLSFPEQQILSKFESLETSYLTITSKYFPKLSLTDLTNYLQQILFKNES